MQSFVGEDLASENISAPKGIKAYWHNTNSIYVQEVGSSQECLRPKLELWHPSAQLYVT